MTRGPTGTSRIVQVHPTRRCNLRCRHCYSTSGPEQRGELPVALLRDALDVAVAEGYGALGVSGGEPLIYTPLVMLLEHAHGLGMVTTATSNGMLLEERRLDELAGVLDLLAISLDGVPASHDRVRAHPGAFAAMAGRLPGVRASGIPFGFIFTLTQHNLHELEWVAQFALEQGASLLQIHPLEEVGRASEQMAGKRPDAVELAFAFLAVARLRTLLDGAVHVQLDLVDRDTLGAQPERVFADEPGIAAPEARLADLVSPLVIEADGEVVPIQHGFPKRFGLGNLNEARLGELIARWRHDRYAAFRRICRATFDDLMVPAELPLANWYEALARRATEAAVPLT